jgi:hypothetical protein
MSRLEQQKLIKIIKHQRSLGYRIRILIIPKAHQDIKISKTNEMPLMHSPRRFFPNHARYSTRQCHPCMRTRRPTRCEFGNGTRKNSLPETNYPAHCNCLSHNCSIRLTHGSQLYNGSSCIVVSISKIDYICSLLNYAEMLNMPQPLYAKKLQAAGVHPSYARKTLHATTSICREASSSMHAVAEYALINQRMLLIKMQKRRTNETRHEGPEGALLFLRATSRV